MDFNFFKQAKDKHGDKYDYSLVKYVNSKTQITIICPIHGEFQQTPYRHTHSHGCVKCSINIRAHKIKLSIHKFITKAMNIHGNRYDYSLSTYVNSKIPLIIICPIHGEFLKTPSLHLNGYGCSKCSNLRKGFNNLLKLNEFIIRSRRIHSDKYDYSKIVELNGVDKLVNILCKQHGEFLQTPHIHLRGCGCPVCGLEVVKNIYEKKRYTKEKFIELSKNKHGDKYDYSLVEYINNKTKVKIICEIHGIFEQKPENHMTAGQGCPICKESKGELRISKYLNINQIKYEREKKFNGCIGIKNKLPFDFYLPEYNILIEYDGKQHFKPEWGVKSFVEIKRNDEIKTEYAKNHNIELIRISFLDKNIEETLNNKLTIYNCE